MYYLIKKKIFYVYIQGVSELNVLIENMDLGFQNKCENFSRNICLQTSYLRDTDI